MDKTGEDVAGEISRREDLLQRAIWAATTALENDRFKAGDFIRLGETSGALAGRQPEKYRFGWSRRTGRRADE